MLFPPFLKTVCTRPFFHICGSSSVDNDFWNSMINAGTSSFANIWMSRAGILSMLAAFMGLNFSGVSVHRSQWQSFSVLLVLSMKLFIWFVGAKPLAQVNSKQNWSFRMVASSFLVIYVLCSFVIDMTLTSSHVLIIKIKSRLMGFSVIIEHSADTLFYFPFSFVFRAICISRSLLACWTLDLPQYFNSLSSNTYLFYLLSLSYIAQWYPTSWCLWSRCFYTRKLLGNVIFSAFCQGRIVIRRSYIIQFPDFRYNAHIPSVKSLLVNS